MIPSKTSSPKVFPPLGTHMARVIEIIYMGTLPTPFKTKDGSDKKQFKLQIKWELPNATHVFKEGDIAKPFVISKEVSHSMDEKSILRPIVEAIIGTSLTDEEAWKFDTNQILGLSCLINIAMNKKGTYPEVKNVTEAMKGMTCPPMVNTPFIFDINHFNQVDFDRLPQFIREKVMTSPEYKKTMGIVEAPVADKPPF